MSKQFMRAAGRVALEQKFQSVSLGRSQGVIPGARLEYVDAGISKSAAVRTTNKDRGVSLLRDERGDWRIIGKVDLVLVVAPAKNDSDRLEIFAFVPDQLKKQFDDKVRIVEKNNRDKKRFRAPVIVPLDEWRIGIGAWHEGLASVSKWKVELKTTEINQGQPVTGQALAIELIKVGIAQSLGVTPDRIDLSFTFRLKDAGEP